MPFKIIILGSGKGSNAEAILKAEKEGNLGNAVTMAIFSDIKDAPILDLAKKYKKNSEYIKCDPFSSKLKNDETEILVNKINKYNPDLVVLAGFMKILDSSIIKYLNGRIINLHPSLLPSFPGLNSIEKAFNYKVKITGCTVHWVTEKLDAGPIIDQASVKFDRNCSIDELKKKVHAEEHLLLPKVIKKISLSEISFLVN